MAAPVVPAKGYDEIAQKITAIAAEHTKSPSSRTSSWPAPSLVIRLLDRAPAHAAELSRLVLAVRV